MAEPLDITTKNCTVEREGHTLIVTLNRPEAKNALSPAMLIGMYKAWRRLDEDDDLYCAVLTGKGDTFCAGMDLKVGVGAGEGEDAEEIQRMMQEIPNLHWQSLPASLSCLRLPRDDQQIGFDPEALTSQHLSRLALLTRADTAYGLGLLQPLSALTTGQWHPGRQ